MGFAVKTSDAWKINPLVMRPASAQPIFGFFFAASLFDVKTAVFPSLVMQTKLFISTLEQAVHCFDHSVIFLCSSPVWILVNHGDCHCVNSDMVPVHVQLCKYFHILMQISDKHLRKPSPYTLWLCLPCSLEGCLTWLFPGFYLCMSRLLCCVFWRNHRELKCSECGLLLKTNSPVSFLNYGGFPQVSKNPGSAVFLFLFLFLCFFLSHPILFVPFFFPPLFNCF